MLRHRCQHMPLGQPGSDSYRLMCPQDKGFYPPEGNLET